MADNIAAVHFVTDKPSDGQTVTNVYADNLPGGGASSIEDGSITGAKLAAKTVTKDKIADGVIPTVPAAPGAATTAKAGLVKKASIAEGADAAAIRTALIAAGIAE